MVTSSGSRRAWRELISVKHSGDGRHGAGALSAPRAVGNVTLAAGGAGPPCAVGFRGTESRREKRRSLSPHSVTVGNAQLALPTTLQGRHYHVPWPMKTLRPGEVKGSACSHFRPNPPPPSTEIVATALAQLLPGLVWENKRAGPCDGCRAGSGDVQLKFRGRRIRKDWSAPGVICTP